MRSQTWRRLEQQWWGSVWRPRMGGSQTFGSYAAPLLHQRNTSSCVFPSPPPSVVMSWQFIRKVWKQRKELTRTLPGDLLYAEKSAR